MSSENPGQAEMPPSAQPPSYTQTPTYTQASRSCVSCGRTINWDSNVCPYCGHDYRFIAAPAAPQQRSAKPLLGGILIIVAGVLALAMAVSFIVLDPHDIENLDYQQLRDSGITATDLDEILGICGAIEIVFGAIAIIGGVFAVMRKHFALAVVGGIFGLIGIGFLVGGLLGLIGLVLIVISRSEFR
jgi:hypothetical protein